MKIGIIGGGIGGLSTALCALRFGHQVTILEQAPKLENIGAGLQLSPNAMRVLCAMGLDEVLKPVVFEPDSIEARMGRSGRSIFNVPLKDYAQQNWKAPYYHIHRADLINALREALVRQSPKSLHLAKRAVSYKSLGDQVKVHIDKAAPMVFDLLVGADGIHSAIRQQMLGSDPARFTGNVAWRAVVPKAQLGALCPPPTACVWMGRGRHAVTYHINGGDYVNFVGVVEREDWQKEGWREKGDKTDLISDFSGWHTVITNLIDHMNEDGLYRWALFDRPPLNKWVDGRVVLQGDAAHPMLPFLAQGAAMAIEDSWSLMQNLQRHDVSVALLHYQKQRLPRTSKVQAASRANMAIFHRRHAFSQLMTYGPMWLAGKLMPSIVHKRMNWLYGYDVTQSE